MQQVPKKFKTDPELGGWVAAVRRCRETLGDKRVSQLMHYAREIIIEPRTEYERYERLPSPQSLDDQTYW